MNMVRIHSFGAQATTIDHMERCDSQLDDQSQLNVMHRIQWRLMWLKPARLCRWSNAGEQSLLDSWGLSIALLSKQKQKLNTSFSTWLFCSRSRTHRTHFALCAPLEMRINLLDLTSLTTQSLPWQMKSFWISWAHCREGNSDVSSIDLS